jgi:hypothetical protein
MLIPRPTLIKRTLFSTALAVFAATPAALLAQSDATISPVSTPASAASALATVVPHFVKFSGSLPDSAGSTVSLRFSLYAAQTGGEPIWSESQSVTLSEAGKYSVLLGVTIPTGLPQDLFTSGAAKWLGVKQGEGEESARTLLLATPYSLKASDSDTLAGHPITDFSLINNSSKPQTGTAVTQINVGNGITGGGTGPTVTLGLSTSYLASLGNSSYAQLNAANTFSKSQTINGTLTVNGSPVVASLTGTNGLQVTHSGNSYTVTAGPGLITLGNTYYAQLAAANTFTMGQTFNAGMTITGQAFTTANVANRFATQGINNATDAGGVYGSGPTAGLQGLGTNTAAGSESFGTYSVTNSVTGVGVYGFGPGTSTATGVYGVEGAASSTAPYLISFGGGEGVWGDTSGTTNATGVLGSADTEAFGGAFINSDGSASWPTLFTLNYNNGAGFPFLALNEYSGTACVIDYSAQLSCDGGFSDSVPTSDRRTVETYSVQSSESWIEDFGSGVLQNGHATVTLEPSFQSTVNTGAEYHVFLTPNGDSKGLYVTSKGPNSFEVHESNGGSSSIGFDYRIVAKQRGKETVRLRDVTELHKRLVQRATTKPTHNFRPHTAPNLSVVRTQAALTTPHTTTK